MKYLIVFILSFWSNQSFGQALSENAKIYLLTCDPGGELYNTFGHSGIQLVDSLSGTNIIFNYGIFDFRTEGFYTKFLRGKLLYNLGIQKMSSFTQTYKREKRSIYQQELNLNADQINTVYNFLVENYKPENRSYKYDFFFDNCSTRIRDLFEKELKIQFPKDESDMTYRNILDEYLVGSPWSDFGIDLIIGSIADKQAKAWNQMFIPDYLHDHLAKAHIDGQALIKSESLILDYITEKDRRFEKPFFTAPVLFFGLFLIEFLLLVFAWKNGASSFIEWYHKLWFVILGISGVVIAFMWFGTDHMATKLNWNLLWLHPFYFISAIFFKNVKHWSHILNAALALITLVGFKIIPQEFHLAIIWVLFIILIKYLYLFFVKGKVSMANSRT